MGTYYLITRLQCSLCPQRKQLELAKLCHFICFLLYKTFFLCMFQLQHKKSVLPLPSLSSPLPPAFLGPYKCLIIYTSGTSPTGERERKREGVKWREIALALLVCC